MSGNMSGEYAHEKFSEVHDEYCKKHKQFILDKFQEPASEERSVIAKQHEEDFRYMDPERAETILDNMMMSELDWCICQIKEELDNLRTKTKSFDKPPPSDVHVTFRRVLLAQQMYIPFPCLQPLFESMSKLGMDKFPVRIKSNTHCSTEWFTVSEACSFFQSEETKKRPSISILERLHNDYYKTPNEALFTGLVLSLIPIQ